MLESHIHKHIRRDKDMIKYLIRKCPRCNRPVKLIKEESTIVQMEGIEHYFLYDMRKHALIHSQKQVRCIHPHPNAGFKGMRCYQTMLISKFKEIKL